MASLTEVFQRLLRRKTRESVGFFVLGMHRSGTSCLTGLLETTGLYLGEVSRTNPFNAKGTLENAGVEQVNEAILRQFGGAWNRPPEGVDCNRVKSRPIKRALRGYLMHSRWALKDPRLLLTLEAWTPHVSRPRFMGAFRHPEAVANSLKTRNGSSLAEGIDLWIRYNRRLVELHRTLQFPLVSFDLRGRDYLRQFKTLCERTGLPFHEDAAKGFYETKLTSHNADSREPLSGEAGELYSYLLHHQIVSVSDQSASEDRSRAA
ncbi:MAG: hypothetical protein N2C14_30245 [Planctomycetales bacterium]